MAEYLEARWEPTYDAPTRGGMRGGRYRCYLPDPLANRPLIIDAALARRAHEVEMIVRRLATAPHSRSLEGLARFMLRSEAIASSKIEGLRVSPQQVALAELATTEDSVKSGFTTNAALVANNITALRQAATELAHADVIDVAAVNRLHRALLPEEKHQGLRTVQNWIGGNDWNPTDAEFVPPPQEQVPALMADLCDYLGGGVHAPLVQAAMVHAQFETVHPYADGNGRVGRALIHTVLVRRGLTPAALLPISLVFLTRSHEYVGGLNAYRHVGEATGAAARDGVSAWLSLAFDAAVIAAQQAELFSNSIATLTDQWRSRLADYRASQGLRALPRADSAQARLVEILPELPVVTARTTQRTLTVSFPAARAALEELAEAKILRRKQVDRGTTGYLATEVFDLITFAERELASTRWDTKESAPARPVPAPP